MFAIADKIELSDNDESRLSKILRAEGRSVFYSPAIAKFYSLDDSKVYPTAGIDISFNGKEITIPAYLVTDAFEISVMVKEGPNGTVKFFEDWKPSKVERKDQNEIASFVAHFTSEEINKYKYKENYEVVLKVFPMGREYAKPLEFHYKAVNTKDNLLKQMTFWTSGIGFERVS